ncbi:8049_t:CDS:2, partial [Gigaspora margarita]
NESLQIVSPRDIVFISDKYVIDNFEECVVIAYASIIDTGKSKCEFDITGIPICTPYCMITVCINRTPKITEEFIHLRADCIEYNSVTGSSNIKMEITILYESQSVRFKHLGASGINIKTGNIYIISEFIKFSDSGKMIIEATDIDFQKFPTNYPNTPEILPDKPKTHSIIDIIANDIDPVTAQTSNQSSFKTMSAFTIPDIKMNSTYEKKNQSKFKVGNDDKEEQSNHEEENEIFLNNHGKSTGFF